MFFFLLCSQVLIESQNWAGLVYSQWYLLSLWRDRGLSPSGWQALSSKRAGTNTYQMEFQNRLCAVKHFVQLKLLLFPGSAVSIYSLSYSTTETLGARHTVKKKNPESWIERRMVRDYKVHRIRQNWGPHFFCASHVLNWVLEKQIATDKQQTNKQTKPLTKGYCYLKYCKTESFETNSIFSCQYQRKDLWLSFVRLLPPRHQAKLLFVIFPCTDPSPCLCVLSS